VTIKQMANKKMKTLHYAHVSILLVLGSLAFLWGAKALHHTLTASDLERIVLENAHGGGKSPEYFALLFVGIGISLLLLGGFDWRWTARRNGG
jgi:hypothetical protein